MKETLNRLTADQIELANNMNLISYAQSIGLELKRAGNSYKIKGYGGLYIDSGGYRWNWFAQNKGGGPIQFAMEMEGKSWRDAVCTLLNIEKSAVAERPKMESIVNKGEFALPEKSPSNKHVIAYLIQTRFIDKEIVYEFINQGKLYENNRLSCVFVGYDENRQPRYASVRSTNTVGESYRGDVKNSDKTYPFSHEGMGNTICVFEAPIDLMSYMNLLKYNGTEINDFHLISLGGVASKALDYYLKAHPEIKHIVLCLDNDEAGHFACRQLSEKFNKDYKIFRQLPIGKDFNEDLKSWKTADLKGKLCRETSKYGRESIGHTGQQEIEEPEH